MIGNYRTDRVVQVDFAAVTTPLPVVSRPSVTFAIPGVNAAVPANTITTLVTYTNSGTEPFFMDGWSGTGQYEGDWFLVVDGVIQPEDRSSASTMRAGHQLSSPTRVAAGSIIDIKVEHYGTGTGQFAATLYGHR